MKWQPNKPYESRPSPHSRLTHTGASPVPPPMPNNYPHPHRDNSHFPSMYRPGFVGQPRQMPGVPIPPPPPPRGPMYYDPSRYNNYHNNSRFSSTVLPHHHLPRFASQAPPPRHLIERSPNTNLSSPTGDLQSTATPTNDPVKAAGCTCKKSRCLKLYCQCFALSSTCGPKCKCQTCHNTTLHAEAIKEARKNILERNPNAFDDKFRGSPTSSPFRPGLSPAISSWQPVYSHGSPPSQVLPLNQKPSRVNKFGCKCRRSFCLKKYCECYQNDVHCGSQCRCENCKNNSSHGDTPPSNEEPEIPSAVPQAASPRSVSDETDPTATTAESNDPSEDPMAIMAAVAMTQLLGKSPRRVSIEGEKNGEKIRKAEHISVSPDSSVDESVKRPKLHRDESPPVFTNLESRNPSPVSVMAQNSYIHQHHHHHHLGMQRHPPPPRILHHHLAHQHRPPNPFPYYLAPPPRASPTYEDVIKSSGLPKSLSFRKICSKCGKTRGEHGELGFGNKCVYQDCGKCGAGIQMHVKAGSPMGILCCLTVEEGAIPGSSASYKRKIRDLAARAELQKSLQEDKRERAERLAQTLP